MTAPRLSMSLPRTARSRRDGATSLYIAAWEDHVQALAALISAGARVDTARTDGATPLSAAEREGHEQVIRLLREHGA